MSPDASAERTRILHEAHLPDDVDLVVHGNGRVLHVRPTPTDLPPADNARAHLTWCNQFWKARNLRPADRETDMALPVCGACLRSQDAQVALHVDEDVVDVEP